jgi:hypothetical protein
MTPPARRPRGVEGEEVAMGPLEWTLIVVLAGVLFAGWRLLGSSPRLSVSRRGIMLRESGLGWILWEEIEGAYPPSAGDADSLFLKLRLSERLSRRLRRRNPELTPRPRAGESFELRLDLSGAEMSPMELLREVVARGRAPEASSSEAYQR